MTATNLPDGVESLLPAHLGRQRWFGGAGTPDAASVSVVEADQLAVTGEGSHRLLWAVVSVGDGPAGGASGQPAAGGPGGDGPAGGAAGGPALEDPMPTETAPGEDRKEPGSPPARYQLLIGERPNGEQAEFLNGHETSVLGSVGDCYYYDATVDPEMALAWLHTVTDGSLLPERVRPVGAEQSNTSLVYDGKFIAKVFRRLPEGANPDIVVTEALDRVGFAHVARPVSVWRRNGTDLAFVQQFLAGGSEGWALALTSLRDLYGSGPDNPRDAGGDFAHEAFRLGRVTAEMHLAMAQAFDVDREQFRVVGWPSVLDEVEETLRAEVGAAYPGSAAQLMARLREIDDPGPAIRVHGDYHLGQVMRTDTGWYVLDFEGEPVRGLGERMSFTSPFKDVTGMLRSFQYAAHYALVEHEAHAQEELAPLGEQWERHNRDAFLDGYLSTSGIAGLLPERPETRTAVSLGFELQKALYELAYERAYRPDWVSIPTAAIQGLLSGS